LCAILAFAVRPSGHELAMTTTLFRPVGLQELALVWDKGMREFPPRLPHQPIFYPVANIEYARTIARDWNTVDEKSGFAGFVFISRPLAKSR
jgi:hypothetical protein